MSTVTVRSVHSKKDEMVFIKFQWVPYRDNPHWVPPLLMDRKKTLDRRRNPFYKHAAMELFLAERNGEPVGRIGAVVNDNHNREHGEKAGFFGFFECIDDAEVSRALLDAATQWLRERGMAAVRGPASPSVNDEYGLLIEGFDRSPAIMMSYNPPYYRRLIEDYGFRKAKDLFAYEVKQETVFSERMVRVAEALKKKEGLRLRSINLKDFDNELKIVRELYSRGWESNWGEVPMTEEEFEYIADDLKQIVDPDLVVIAEVKGKPVGFGLALPDLNIILRGNKRGHLLPAVVRMVLLRKRVHAVRIVILGVVPEYRNTGLGVVLFYEVGRRGIEKGYDTGEASWVLEDNVMMNRGAELMNGVKTKVYRIYEMQL